MDHRGVGLAIGMLAGLCGPGVAAAQPMFTESVIDVVLSYIRDVDLADVDDDGDTDIVVANLLSNSQVYFENDGMDPPTWTTRTFSTSGGMYNVAVGDINGDGFTDILGSRASNEDVVWFESDGGTPPVFTVRDIALDAGTDPYAAALADLDGDGDLDALISFNEDQTLIWYENGGGLAPAWTSRLVDGKCGNLRAFSVGDVDGDGDLDWLTSAFNVFDVPDTVFDDAGIALYENQGEPTPTFVKKEVIRFQFNGTAYDHVLADIDGDGDLDVIGHEYSPGLVFYMENDGQNPVGWTRREVGDAGSQTFELAVADLDFDGDLDVVTCERDADTVKWFENTTDGAPGPLTWTLRTLATTLDRPEHVEIGDVTNDGAADIVAGWIGTRKVSVHASDAEPPLDCAGDANGDGVTDVFDFNLVTGNFGTSSGATREDGDLTGDGSVNVFDFNAVTGDFGCGT